MRKILCISLLLVLFCLSTGHYGAGFALYEMGGRAVAMGGAFTGLAKDGSALYFNPAGISFLEGNSVLAGTQLIFPQSKFTPAEPVPGGDEAVTEDQVFTPIHLYVNYRAMEKLNLGFAVFNPYGLGLKWQDPEKFTGRYVSYDAKLEYFDIAFSASYRVVDCLSLSAGIDAVFGSVTLKRYPRLFEGNPNSYVGNLELEGNSDLAYSFNTSAFYVKDKLSVGISYRHKIKTEFNDGDGTFEFYDTPVGVMAAANLNAKQKVDTEITLPANLSFGVGYQITEKLLAAFSFNYVMWSSFDTLTLDFTGDEKVAPDTKVIEDYEDTYLIRLGLEYQLNKKLALRAGYVYDRTPQPKESMSSLLGDASRNDLGLGFGYNFGKWNIDVSYLGVFFEDRDTFKNGKPVQYDHLDGAYSSVAHIFGVSFGYLF